MRSPLATDRQPPLTLKLLSDVSTGLPHSLGAKGHPPLTLTLHQWVEQKDVPQGTPCPFVSNQPMRKHAWALLEDLLRGAAAPLPLNKGHAFPLHRVAVSCGFVICCPWEKPTDGAE